MFSSPRQKYETASRTGTGYGSRSNEWDSGLRARVRKNVLEGCNSGPFRQTVRTRIMRCFSPNQFVPVKEREGKLGARTKVLYAPDNADGEPFVETEFVTTRPASDDLCTLVYRDDPFEIRVCGMFVRPFDKCIPLRSCSNELLMYSVETDPSATGENNQSLPYIHFDHRRDGYNTSERPNQYIPIPATTSFVAGSLGKNDRTTSKSKSRVWGKTAVQSTVNEEEEKPEEQAEAEMRSSKFQKSVNVQFRILELDTPSESVKQTVAAIDSLGAHLSGLPAVPYLGLLSPAMSIAGAVGKQALEAFARPDKVMITDMDFLLADRKRVESNTARTGEYLRYGYYFFLSEPLEGKIYASVQTPKNVELMLKRRDGESQTSSRNQIRYREFFPLTEVNYIVVRVSEATVRQQRSRKPIKSSHAIRLKEIFRDVYANMDSQHIAENLRKLGEQLGLYDSDSESEGAASAQ